MICKNCGAYIADHTVVCPYCGYEDTAEAKAEHDEEIRNIHERTREVRGLKERTAQRASGSITKVMLILLAAFIVFLAAAFIVSGVKAKTAKARQDKQLAKLEELYNAGEYEEMYQYLEKCEHSYRDTYGKYTRVANAYHYQQNELDYLYEWMDPENGRTLTEENLAFDYYFIFGQMEQMKEYEDEGYPYGEEDGIILVHDEYVKFLTERGKLTEDEIDAAVQRYADMKAASEQPDGEDFMDYAELTLTRSSS